MIDSPVIAAGIFGSVGMLLWACAALAPLLLHLWNKHQHQEVSWAAMEFLLAAVEQQARRMRLEQLLLLLLRMAIPVVLGLALADPIWEWFPSLGTSLGARAPGHHLLVFDTSYSMGYRLDGESRLDHARRAAQDIIEASEQGDGFTLLTMAGPAQVVIGSPVFSADDLFTEIAGLTLSDTAADLSATLDLINQTLSEVRRNHPRLERHRVYFLTDLGANTWQATRNAPIRERCAEIADGAELIVLDLGVEDPSNTVLSEVVRLDATTTVAEPVGWRVTMEDLRGAARGAKTVTMLVDGQPVSRRTVEPLAGQQASSVFRYHFDSAGQHQVEFRLDDDALPVDDRHYEIITVRDAVKVLCVGSTAGSARNVALALAPHAEEASIQTRVTVEHRLADFDLLEFDCVFLCNLSRFTAEGVSRLRDYLKQGHSIVMFLGDQVKPDNYNELLANLGDGPLLPATLGPLAPPGSYVFDPRDYRHPIIRPFRGQERAGLLTTPIWQYFRLQLPEDSRADVVLSFANGDPAIIEHRVELGRVILVATAASEQSVSRIDGRLTPWTAWAAWPSFPPLVQEMLAWALAAQDQNRNLFVGDPLGATLPPGATSRFVMLTHQVDGQTRPSRVPVLDVQGTASWIFEDTFQVGYYSAELPDDDLPTTNFALNLTVGDESRLERLPQNQLPEQFLRQSINTTVLDADTATAATSLFRLLLALLLALLLLESYVAWFLGNARA